MKVKIQKPVLTSEPTRTFTNRECTMILGSLLGGLCQYAGVVNVHEAVSWWATNDDAWRFMQSSGADIMARLRDYTEG